MPSIGLNTWLYGTFPAGTPCYELEVAIDHIGDLEYDAVELGAAGPHAWPPSLTDGRREQIDERLAANDLRLSSVCPALGGGPGLNPGSPLPEIRDATRDHYVACVDLADGFGADLVVFVGGWHLADQSREEAWENMRDVLADVIDAAASRGLTVAVEATPADSEANLVDTAQDQRRLLDEVDAPNLGANLDTFHVAHRGNSPVMAAQQLGSDLVHLHLADSDRLPPGAGDIAFRPLFDRLDDVGYDGEYTVEIFGSDLLPDEAAWRAKETVASLV